MGPISICEMKRVVYSLYIDIPTPELDNQNPYFWDTISKSERTKIALKQNYDRLLEVKQKYCEHIGVDFHMFEYDDAYKRYEQYFKDAYPQITTYNIVNFYKIHLLYELAKSYDQIIYFDFDVVPCTNQSFFDSWDLEQGMCLLENNKDVNKRKVSIFKINHSVRSPTAKFYNAQAMLHEQGMSGDNDVINTGIIGACAKHISQLKYFDNFEDTLALMDRLRQSDNDTIYPPNIVNMFGYDNETVFSYKLRTQNVPVQWLDQQWHYFYDVEMHIPPETKIIHAINKKFDFVWRFYEKCNL